MPNPLFDRLFGIHAGKNHPFLHLLDGEVITYQAYLTLVARLSHTMMNLGLKPGDRVAVQVEKSPEALALYAACVQSGLVFLPLNTGYTIDELRYFIADSAAALIICDNAKYAELIHIANTQGAQIHALNADGSGSLIDSAKKMPEIFNSVDRNMDDLAALLYTSGTTGRSKGAMLTQQNLLSNAQVLAQAWQFTQSDVLLHALPIFHTHGLFVATNVTLAAGGSMVFLPKFNVDTLIEWLPRSSTMMGVPTFYTRLLADPRLTAAVVKHMRLFISGSAPLLAQTHRAFENRTGHRILERYGMTETNMNTSNPYAGERREGSVGFPLPGVELKITDPETGAQMAPEDVGQIEVRGANVFKGYWKMPEKTALELRPDGFFITGDLGKIDQDGYVHIVGRNKDLIISGGYNIYPKEIELILDEQSDIIESAVIGIPDADFGEAVLAVVVTQAHSKPHQHKWMEALRNSLAKYKLPKHIEICTELPRNAMGKVQKNILRERYAALFTD